MKNKIIHKNAAILGRGGTVARFLVFLGTVGAFEA